MYIVPVFIAALAAGYVLGPRHNRGILSAFVVVAWWIMTYPAGRPDLGGYVLAGALGFLIGAGVASIVGTIRGGGSGGGRGPDDDGPPAAPEPDPGGRVLTTEDFAQECAAQAAPMEPARTKS